MLAIALVILFVCFFHYGQEWMFIPAALLFLGAIGINLNVKQDEPTATVVPPPHHQE
jgi:hypothetical protein